MDAQVCISCLNKKSVNVTNRLVTESCGHVKCVNCLVLEKTGCAACADSNPAEAKVEPSDVPLSDTTVQTDFPLGHFLLTSDVSSESQTQTVCYYDKKNQLETSHIRVESDENGRSYLCTVCQKRFHSRSQVLYHAFCNGQPKPYQCSDCNKSFSTQSHYKYHMRVHRNERNYACDDCGESFFQMSKLQRHKLKHTKEKKYECADCHKCFNNPSSLRKHGLLHSGERPLECAHCGRRFRDASNLRKHVLKHNRTGGGARGLRGATRAHRCPRCPQAFHARRDLRRHAAVHDDTKAFRCKSCNRRFRRKDNLERHVRNSHPQEASSPAPADEKTKLEILNPLPPLPPEVFQQLSETDEQYNVTIGTPTETEKSMIMEANNARRSVIFGPVRRARSPETYVHKIRRANVASCARDVPLPPIDERKILELEEKNHQNNLDVGAPPVQFRELYKKILYERTEKEAALAAEEEKQQTNPEMHWRRKMKLGINW